ncbi:hypothetical protein JYU34_005752 [Plutella xylostella]|uniref:Uncharacterized protein n=1 Tax=Plutella xylostella TaxID=51655 RepID=A0ABQ7QU40_PLUXY|nr:hypothetical protein JYU34_005752 [Plutella xylostella]
MAATRLGNACRLSGGRPRWTRTTRGPCWRARWTCGSRRRASPSPRSTPTRPTSSSPSPNGTTTTRTRSTGAARSWRTRSSRARAAAATRTLTTTSCGCCSPIMMTRKEPPCWRWQRTSSGTRWGSATAR